MALSNLTTYLSKCVEAGASDIFIQAGSPVFAKVNGKVMQMSAETLNPRDSMRFITEMYGLAQRDKDVFEAKGDDDFSFYMQDVARFRANAYHQRGSTGAVVRIVAFHIPKYQDVHIPDAIMELADAKSGLIVICGPAGSGKSTTQACMIDRINHTRDGHIITIEDPIEYIHKNDKALITQREIPIDAESFESALRAALRQTPDVILLGEMRDYDTIRAVVTAAETGHLVIATLHTLGAVNSIDRIIDSFPAEQQAQIRLQVSMVLRAVVSQRLLPCVDGQLRPAFELLGNTLAVRNLIREKSTHQINSIIISGRSDGMFSMDESIIALYKDGAITAETALLNANNYDFVKTRIAI